MKRVEDKLKLFFQRLLCNHAYGDETKENDVMKIKLTDAWSSETGSITSARFIQTCSKCGKAKRRWRVIERRDYGGIMYQKYE
jgi:hypothetical protein